MSAMEQPVNDIQSQLAVGHETKKHTDPSPDDAPNDIKKSYQEHNAIYGWGPNVLDDHGEMIEQPSDQFYMIPVRYDLPGLDFRAIEHACLSIKIKIQLLTVMDRIYHSGGKDAELLHEALTGARDALAKVNTHRARDQGLIGRCCYYVGIATYLSYRKTPQQREAMDWFKRALIADGDYIEGKRAQQWIEYLQGTSKPKHGNQPDGAPPQTKTSSPKGGWFSSIGSRLSDLLIGSGSSTQDTSGAQPERIPSYDSMDSSVESDEVIPVSPRGSSSSRTNGSQNSKSSMTGVSSDQTTSSNLSALSEINNVVEKEQNASPTFHHEGIDYSKSRPFGTDVPYTDSPTTMSHKEQEQTEQHLVQESSQEQNMHPLSSASNLASSHRRTKSLSFKLPGFTKASEYKDNEDDPEESRRTIYERRSRRKSSMPRLLDTLMGRNNDQPDELGLAEEGESPGFDNTRGSRSIDLGAPPLRKPTREDEHGDHLATAGREHKPSHSTSTMKHHLVRQNTNTSVSSSLTPTKQENMLAGVSQAQHQEVETLRTSIGNDSSAPPIIDEQASVETHVSSQSSRVFNPLTLSTHRQSVTSGSYTGNKPTQVPSETEEVAATSRDTNPLESQVGDSSVLSQDRKQTYKFLALTEMEPPSQKMTRSSDPVSQVTDDVSEDTGSPQSRLEPSPLLEQDDAHILTDAQVDAKYLSQVQPRPDHPAREQDRNISPRSSPPGHETEPSSRSMPSDQGNHPAQISNSTSQDESEGSNSSPPEHEVASSSNSKIQTAQDEVPEFSELADIPKLIARKEASTLDVKYAHRDDNHNDDDDGDRKSENEAASISAAKDPNVKTPKADIPESDDPDTGVPDSEVPVTAGNPEAEIPQVNEHAEIPQSSESASPLPPKSRFPQPVQPQLTNAEIENPSQQRKEVDDEAISKVQPSKKAAEEEEATSKSSSDDKGDHRQHPSPRLPLSLGRQRIGKLSSGERKDERDKIERKPDRDTQYGDQVWRAGE